MTRRQLLFGAGLSLARPRRLGATDDAFRALGISRLPRPLGPKPFTVPLSGGSTPPRGQSGQLSLDDHRGDVVFLNFWATWCPPCLEEMPAIERLSRRYDGRGLTVLALSVDHDGDASVLPFIKERGFSFRVGLDREMRIATLYGVRALPSTFLLDRRGRLVATAIGPRVWDSPEAFLVIEETLAAS